MQINEIADLKAISTSYNLWCRYRKGEQQTAWTAASAQRSVADVAGKSVGVKLPSSAFVPI